MKRGKYTEIGGQEILYTKIRTNKREKTINKAKLSNLSTCLRVKPLLRQGDPLSPFLFTLVVDVLSHLVSRAIDNGLVKGIVVGGEQVVVSHL